MHASRLPLLAVALCLTAAAPAAAQSPTGPSGPTGPTPTPTIVPAITPVPTATPEPARDGRLRISVNTAQRNRGHKVALKGQRLIVKGALRPAIRGQRVTVRLTQGSKTVMTRRARTRASGKFRVVLKARATGRLAVRAAHQRSPRIRRTTAKAVRLQSFAPSLTFGSKGALVRLFQKGLSQMKYPTSRSGTYDAATGRAVMAYRKVNGLARTEYPSAQVIRGILAGKGAYKVRHPKAGHHVEADISRQILALVDGDRVVRVEPTSSGAPATPTVIGTFRFYSQTPGTNSKGMVHSSYFIRGYAIHGYASVPAYNASHGCLRIPIPDAWYVFNWINLGDRIFVDY